MDVSKLSQVKQGILRRAYRFGYVGDMSYPKEKWWLYEKGWLRGRRVGNIIISGQWELTDEARRAVEGRK